MSLPKAYWWVPGLALLVCCAAAEDEALVAAPSVAERSLDVSAARRFIVEQPADPEAACESRITSIARAMVPEPLGQLTSETASGNVLVNGERFRGTCDLDTLRTHVWQPEVLSATSTDAVGPLPARTAVEAVVNDALAQLATDGSIDLADLNLSSAIWAHQMTMTSPGSDTIPPPPTETDTRVTIERMLDGLRVQNSHVRLVVDNLLRIGLIELHWRLVAPEPDLLPVATSRAEAQAAFEIAVATEPGTVLLQESDLGYLDFGPLDGQAAYEPWYVFRYLVEAESVSAHKFVRIPGFDIFAPYPREGPPGLPICDTFTLDFDTGAAGEMVPAGAIATDQWAHLGIHVSASNPNRSHDAAVVFDSANPTGADFDLGTPNGTWGGPGIGFGLGAASGNSTPLLNILVVAENTVDNDSDGLIDDPDDDALGGVIILTLDQPLDIVALRVVDIDRDEPGGGIVSCTDADGSTLFTPIDVVGDNSAQVVRIDANSVVRLEVEFVSSGGLAEVVYCVPQSGG